MEPSLTEPVTLIKKRQRPADPTLPASLPKRKRPRTTAGDALPPFPITFPRLLDGHEPAFHRDLRQGLYHHDAAIASSVFLHAWDQAHAATVADLAHFVEQAWAPPPVTHRRPVHTIPTALVLSGVNVADNFRAFDMLATKLAASSCPNGSAPILTVTLTSDSLSSLRLALRTILAGFTGTPSDDTDDLTAWFAAHPHPPRALTLLLPAFESCDFTILSRLIPILATTLAPAGATHRLPLVLVMGISSLLETVSRALDPGALSHLCTTSYRLVAGRDALDHALRALFLDLPAPAPAAAIAPAAMRMRLTAPMLDWMLSRFHHATHSGAETARAVKYALMDHYFGGGAGGSALSSLATGDPEGRERAVMELIEDQCQLVRGLPSVRAWMERMATLQTDDGEEEESEGNEDKGQLAQFRRALQVLQSDAVLKDQALCWLAELDVAVARHARAVCLVHAMQARLAKVTRRSLARLYVMSLEENLATSAEDSAGVRVFVALIQKVAWDGHTAPVTVLTDILNVLSTIRGHLCHSAAAGEGDETDLVAEVDAHVATHAAFMAEIQSESSDPDEGSGESDHDDDSDSSNNDGPATAQEDLGDRLLATMHKTLERSKDRPLRSSRPARGERRKLQQAAAAPAPSGNEQGQRSVNQLALALLDRESSDRASWSAAKRMLSRGKRATDKGRPLHQRVAQFVASVCDWLMRVLEVWLEPPTRRPLAEVRFQGRVAALDRTFTILPSSLVKTALSRPELFLSSVTADQDEDSQAGDVVLVRPTDPDTCILYKLHLESGRLVNLFDWFTAFRAVIARGPGYEIPAEQGKQEDEVAGDQEAQITKQQRRDFVRFIRGVNELQMLGFVKSTSRKTDHVVRLTWGKV